MINLDRQTRRWAFMSAQLANLGLAAQRLPAVNGYDPAALADAASAPYGDMPNGEIGCFESHRRAWRHIIDNDLPGAFILEDDVLVSSDFANLAFDPELLATVDVIKLDACDWSAAYGPVRAEPAPGRVLRPLWGTETSAACYFMTRRGAEKMLRHSRGYFIPVDTLMFNIDSKPYHDLVTLKLEPSAAVQLRYVMEEARLAPEIADAMQQRRRLGQDQRPTRALARRLRLMVRRLRDRDIRAVRRARAEAFRKRNGPAEERVIAFHTTDRRHFESAAKLLDDAPAPVTCG